MEDCGFNIAPRHPTSDAVIASNAGPTANETITNPAGASTATDGHPNDMLDVHSPHGAAHTWKDFWIHLGTISIGLLIAIGLEQSVEAIHRLHEIREAARSAGGRTPRERSGAVFRSHEHPHGVI